MCETHTSQEDLRLSRNRLIALNNVVWDTLASLAAAEGVSLGLSCHNMIARWVATDILSFMCPCILHIGLLICQWLLVEKMSEGWFPFGSPGWLL